MNDSEKPKFAQSMAAIGEIYGKDISEVMVGIYWNALKPYPVEDVMRSFQGHTRDTDNGQFFPKPADLLRHIEGNKDGKALMAWSKAYRAICSYGRRNSVGKRAARTVLTGMCYSVGSATRQGSSSLTRFIGQSAMTSRT
ncbi:hypothetical protein ACSJD8_03680 [Klebsiella variicola]|uniref:hypothetical protein n=1 Tax=Klebsiella variicola TaxID=244366 RepID=UPI003EDAA146